VHLSGDATLTGICCINMDQDVEDEKITAILETVSELRDEQEGSGGKLPG
jgi:hypothetical protein